MISIDIYRTALFETMYMTFASTALVLVFGFIVGALLYYSSAQGLKPNKLLYSILSFIVSIGRSIPFLILIVLLIPVTRIIVGTILGPSAAIPALVVGGTPFYARIVELALNEKGESLRETGVAFGLSNFKIITKILIPETLPALIRGITVTSITLASFTSIAGAIGAGGLGDLAYLYGYARNRHSVTLISTALVVALVVTIQLLGDLLVKRLSPQSN